LSFSKTKDIIGACLFSEKALLIRASTFVGSNKPLEPFRDDFNNSFLDGCDKGNGSI